jgi:hypothetical protein
MKNPDTRARQALISSGVSQDPGASFDNCGHEQDDLVMAKTVNVIVTDDLDGSEGAKAVLFSFQGASYEIDLSPGNEAKLAESLAPYIKAARKAGGPRRAPRTAAVRQDRAAIRAWARDQGIAVSERGRISSDIIAKYQAAH